MTDTLAVRLHAAIGETERIAREALEPTGPTVDVTVNGQPQLPTGNTNRTAYSAETLRYLVAQQPDAVLRRCAADRKILTEHAAADFTAYGDQLCRRCTVNNDASDALHDWMIWPCPTLLALAEGYGITQETT